MCSCRNFYYWLNNCNCLISLTNAFYAARTISLIYEYQCNNWCIWCKSCWKEFNFFSWFETSPKTETYMYLNLTSVNSKSDVFRKNILTYQNMYYGYYSNKIFYAWYKMLISENNTLIFQNKRAHLTNPWPRLLYTVFELQNIILRADIYL